MDAVSDDDAEAGIGRCSVLDDAGGCCCLSVLSLRVVVIMFEYLLHIFCIMMSARANMQTAGQTSQLSCFV